MQRPQAVELKLREFKAENHLLGKLLQESLAERKALEGRLDAASRALQEGQELRRQLEGDLQEMQQRVRECDEGLSRSLEAHRVLEAEAESLRSELMRRSGRAGGASPLRESRARDQGTSGSRPASPRPCAASTSSAAPPASWSPPGRSPPRRGAVSGIVEPFGNEGRTR